MKAHIGRYPKNPKLDRKIKIEIEPHDAWNVDDTISLIAIPLLKKYRENLHGCPGILCPEILDKDGKYVDSDHEAGMEAWKLILDKMIWAHEQVIDEKFEEFYIFKGDVTFEKIPDEDLFEMQSTSVINWDAKAAYHDRVQEGLNLFAQFYLNLWD
jgi:hypothetical protein